MKPGKVSPPNYQEAIKAREFLAFLKAQGVLVEETEGLSRMDSGDDSRLVKSKLHCGVRLLISNSRKQSRLEDKLEFVDLLITQGAFFLASRLEDVRKLGLKIVDFLDKEALKTKGISIEAENMEIDFYTHGWVVRKFGLKIADFLDKEALKTKGISIEAENMKIDFYTHGWVDTLSLVKASTSISMGIEKEVVPMICETPEPRPDVSRVKPQKVTPLAKGNANVINVGEAAGTSDDSLPKKIAQLERALTYVALRANNSNIEEVVGYGALCMSMVDGSSLASVIINLNPEVFPYLAKLQKKGGLAYLFSRRTIVDDIEKMIEHYGTLEQGFRRLERRIFVVGAVGVVVGAALVGAFALAVHRKG